MQYVSVRQREYKTRDVLDESASEIAATHSPTGRITDEKTGAVYQLVTGADGIAYPMQVEESEVF